MPSRAWAKTFMLSSAGIKADPPAAFIYQYLATTGPAQSKLSVQASLHDTLSLWGTGPPQSLLNERGQSGAIRSGTRNPFGRRSFVFMEVKSTEHRSSPADRLGLQQANGQSETRRARARVG
jgi:hypothetical protein